MIEGLPPFSTKQENEVPKAYVANERPPFTAPLKLYSYGIKEYALFEWIFFLDLNILTSSEYLFLTNVIIKDDDIHNLLRS